MPVTIKGTGGGSVTLTAGAAAADTTLTLPNTTGTVINTAPGTSGNVLTSNGTAWTSAAVASGGGQLQSVVFTSSTTWTCPTGVTKVYAICVGGGGASAQNTGACGFTGYGGYAGVAAAFITVVPGTVYTLTVGLGAAGVNGSTVTAGSGGTTSFGSLVTATGGGGGSVTPSSGTQGASGTGSTTGTAIRLANASAIPASGPLGGNPYYGSTLTALTWSTSVAVGAGANGASYVGTAANGSYSGAIYIQYVG